MGMEARLKLSKQSMQPLVDAITYQSIAGSLRYLVNIHPDIAFVIGYVSHFLEEPLEDHLVAVKQILRYVVGTSNWGRWFGRKKRNLVMLTRFSDADFAGDDDERKSTTAVIFFLVNNPVTWQSMKQKGGGPIQLRVRVYCGDKCNVSDSMACSCASRGAGICVEHAIPEGGQQVHHCINQESGTPRIYMPIAVFTSLCT
jgi:hypothetical protein